MGRGQMAEVQLEIAAVISPERFAHTPSFWRDCMPMADHAIKLMRSEEFACGDGVPGTPDRDRSSVIAELAFAIAAAQNDDVDLEAAEAQALARVARLRTGGQFKGSLTDSEKRQAEQLSSNLRGYLDLKRNLRFSPTIPGCGIVSPGFADVMTGTELIEVKSVERAFSVGDLRQATAYAALLYSKDITISRITLLNGRRGRYVTQHVDVIAAVSAGIGAHQLFQNVVEMASGIQVSA